jgi:transposase-like protein
VEKIPELCPWQRPRCVPQGSRLLMRTWDSPSRGSHYGLNKLRVPSATSFVPPLRGILSFPGSTIYTDGLKSFAGLSESGFQHIPRTQPLRSELRQGAKSTVPLADRAIGNLQQWLIGTYHGVSRANSNSMWTSSSSGIVAVNKLRPHFKPYSVLELSGNQRRISAYAARWTWLMRVTPTYNGLLKQPDEQKVASPNQPLRAAQSKRFSRGYFHGLALEATAWRFA